MKFELPEFKRCCCCIPLRYGLLGWGYIKLIISLLILLFITHNLVIYIRLMMVYDVDLVHPEIIMGFMFGLIVLVDTALTIVFLVGGHRKTAKLLRVYYIYSVVFLCISALFFFGTTALELFYIGYFTRATPKLYVSFGLMAQTKLLTGLTNLGIQLYVALLIRSEVVKLKNNSKFRFANIATEAKCAMENGTITDTENGTDVHINVTNEDDNETCDEFEEPFDQTKLTHCETFTYKKF